MCTCVAACIYVLICIMHEYECSCRCAYYALYTTILYDCVRHCDDAVDVDCAIHIGFYRNFHKKTNNDKKPYTDFCTPTDQLQCMLFALVVCCRRPLSTSADCGFPLKPSTAKLTASLHCRLSINNYTLSTYVCTSAFCLLVDDVVTLRCFALKKHVKTETKILK